MRSQFSRQMYWTLDRVAEQSFGVHNVSQLSSAVGEQCPAKHRSSWRLLQFGQGTRAVAPTRYKHLLQPWSLLQAALLVARISGFGTIASSSSNRQITSRTFSIREQSCTSPLCSVNQKAMIIASLIPIIWSRHRICQEHSCTTPLCSVIQIQNEMMSLHNSGGFQVTLREHSYNKSTMFYSLWKRDYDKLLLFCITWIIHSFISTTISSPFSSYLLWLLERSVEDVVLTMLT